jgi:hypothetical protein
MREGVGLGFGLWRSWRNSRMAILLEDKVIITVATVGGVARTKGRNINVPEQPDEIARGQRPWDYPIGDSRSLV